MSGHEHWDELAAGHALHGLAPDEQAEFVAHLETCEECTASVSEHEFVAAQLGAMAHYRDSDEPPSWESMRDAILAAGPAEHPVVDLAAHRRRYDVSRRVLAVAAAVAVLAGGGVAAWRLTTNGGGTHCTTSAGCHVVVLEAGAGRHEASLVVRNNRVSVTATSLPPTPTGKVYVLWQLPRNGRATPVTSFTAGSGSSPTSGTLRVAYSDTAAFAVSLENAASAPPATPSNTVASGATS